jgi:hypothetical protein
MQALWSYLGDLRGFPPFWEREGVEVFLWNKTEIAEPLKRLMFFSFLFSLAL